MSFDLLDEVERRHRSRATGDCWDCDHPIARHSGSYPSPELRDVPKDLWPAKTPDTGCLLAGCECRRWFEVQR